jgi:hypothetical protein
MIAHYRIDTRKGDWNIHQPANEDEVRFRVSALAFKCLADDDIAGSQLCPGTPTSLSQDQVLINSLSLHSSFLAPQTQHAARKYDKVTIQVLRESQIDMPMKDYIPSPLPMELAMPSKAGTDYEPASKTSPPQDEPEQELDDAQQSRVRSDPEQEPDVNVDYEPLLQEGQCADVTLVPTISELKMMSDSRLAGYVISSAEGRRFGTGGEPHLVNRRQGPWHRASSSLATKGPASKGQQKSADRSSGQLSVAVCAVRMLQGSQATQASSGTSSRTKSFTPCLARPPRPSVPWADLGRPDWILRHRRLRMVCLRLYPLLGIAGYPGLDGRLRAMGRSREGAARCNAIRHRQPQTQPGMGAAGRGRSCPAQRAQATSTADLPGRGPWVGFGSDEPEHAPSRRPGASTSR